MAPNYTVRYFPLRALAESVRLILSYSGINFEDVRVPIDEWPGAHKNAAPYGQMPLLEVDGKVMNQHVAICRYLAKQAKLNGSNDLEDYEIDSMVDNITDFRIKVFGELINRKDRPRTLVDPKPRAMMEEYIPFMLSRFDTAASSGYLCNNKLSWADLFFFSFVETWRCVIGANFLDKYSNLQKVEQNVLELPGIKAWVDKRPAPDFKLFTFCF